jgi:hypothetical protein
MIEPVNTEEVDDIFTMNREARRLRDIVFGKAITDGEWQHCAHSWIRDLPWLREQAAKMKS